jgi:peptidoglycan/xylan/chitin deacetylase (PgdA/CDA1 family)
MVLRALFGALSPGGPRARLSVLIFHRVLPETDPLFPGEVTRARFDQICGWVKTWFNVLPLDEAAHRLSQGTLPPRALALSFDDGYADNRTVAAPVLQSHGLPCTFFIATGFLDGGRMWNDTLIEAVRGCTGKLLDLTSEVPALGALPLNGIQARRLAIDRLIGHCKYMPPAERQALVDRIAERSGTHLPRDLMMSSGQVRELRQMGMQIGAHTVNHPILAALPRADALREMVTSKQTLEDILGEPVTLFAYPNGKPGEDYSDESVRLAREAGFSAAVSTQPGVSNRATDLFQLRRFTPWDQQRWKFGARLAQNALRPA